MSKENLQHAVRDTRSVAGQLVTSKTGGVEHHTTLRSPVALVTGAGKRTAVVLWVVGRVERGGGVLGETLGAVPGHVLDGEESSVCAEKHVEVAGADDGVVCVLDDALEDAVVGGAGGGVGTLVVAVAEDVGVGALEPLGADVGVECHLDVGAVEVDFGTWGRVVAGVDYAKLGVWVRACLSDVVDVEAGVHLENGGVEVVELVAGVVLRAVWVGENRESALWWWEGEVLVHIVGVTALLVVLGDLLHECVVQEEQVLPKVYEGEEDNLLLDGLVTNDGVVDGDTSKVEVLVIIGSNEAVGNVGDVVTGVRLSGDVGLPVVESEEVNEALVETTELVAELNLIGDVGGTLRVANTYGLLNPEHVGEVGP